MLKAWKIQKFLNSISQMAKTYRKFKTLKVQLPKWIKPRKFKTKKIVNNSIIFEMIKFFFEILFFFNFKENSFEDFNYFEKLASIQCFLILLFSWNFPKEFNYS